MSTRLNTPLFGLDYTTEIPVAVLKSAGVRFVYRYISHDLSKCITRGEADRLKAADIGICLVFEDGGFTGTFYGHDDGRAHAEYAIRYAIEMVGKPVIPRPIVYAVDTDRYSPEQVAPYFEGLATVHRRQDTGPYGSKNMVSYCFDHGFGAGFQTYAWSYGQLDTRAKVYQYWNERYINGYNVDFDHAFYSDYGQWNYRPPAPPDPFDVLRTEKFTFSGNLKIDERGTALSARGALEHVVKFHNWLRELWRRLKLLRDRIWFVVHYHWDGRKWVPFPKSELPKQWAAFKRDKRWQVLNNEMLRIAKAVKI